MGESSRGGTPGDYEYIDRSSTSELTEQEAGQAYDEVFGPVDCPDASREEFVTLPSEIQIRAMASCLGEISGILLPLDPEA